MSWQIGDHLLLGFEDTTLPPEVADELAEGTGHGVPLFHHATVVSSSQVRELTDQVRRAAGRPVLVCVDQEGGQFLGPGGDTTPFADNLALGAIDDPDLTRRVAAAMGAEVRACGVDVDYAPVCDLLTTPANPGLGIRTFGDDPDAGAIACAFPGKGDAAVDSHHDLPVLRHDLDHLRGIELVPFRAALAAGAGMVMSSHAAYPAVTGRGDLPTSSRVLAVQPAPFDRTPADTSSTVAPLLAPALDGHAHPQQVALVDALVASHAAVVTLSLRVPLDATLVPATTTHLCTYGVLSPSLHAVADALVGATPISGRLPMSLAGHLRGSGLQVVA